MPARLICPAHLVQNRPWNCKTTTWNVLGLAHTSRDIFEHGDFFSLFSLPSTRKRRCFMDQKRRISKTVPRVNIFGNAGLSLFESLDGQRRIIRWCHVIQRILCKDVIVFPLFYRFRVDGRKRLEYATCGRILFRKRRKKYPFSKIFRHVWTRPKTFQVSRAVLVTTKEWIWFPSNKNLLRCNNPYRNSYLNKVVPFLIQWLFLS